MKTVINILNALFIISLVLSFVYIIYMITKKRQYPEMDFSRFCDKKNRVSEIEQLTNKAIRGVNGWMWLATAFMTIYYFLNFWAIVFMMINLVVVIYEVDGYKNYTIFLLVGSLLFTFLDLWINSKEKSVKFHNHWFNTSIITKEYIVKFSAAKTFDELCDLVSQFNKLIYEENAKISFL